ncbi:MAG: domain S-box [Fibrobacteres bacterium]|nr:domain S-box [Fibrobacterota bacterium]
MEFFRKSRIRLVLIALFSLVLVLEDFLSGPLLQTPLLYIFPIGLAAWYLGERWSILFALGLSLGRAYLTYRFWQDTIPVGIILINLGLRSFVYILLAELVTRHARLHRLQQRRLDLILDHLPVGIGISDAQGRIVFANPEEKAIWGGVKYVDPGEYAEYHGWRPGDGRMMTGEEWALFRTMKSGKPILREAVDIETFDGARKTILNSTVLIQDELDRPLGAIIVNQDITLETNRERQNLALIQKLEEAMANIKVLKGLLPICASCKKIRDDGGYWNQIEVYLHDHSDLEFSHGICPDCAARMYPDYVPAAIQPSGNEPA